MDDSHSRTLSAGDPAPQFTGRVAGMQPVDFHNWAGRHVVLSFLGRGGVAGSAPLVDALSARRDVFNNDFAAFCIVSADPADEQVPLPQQPGRALFSDPDGGVSALYGLGETRASVIMDPYQRVVTVIPMTDPASHAQEIIACLTGLARQPWARMPPPVLMLPRLFEPDLCRTLIGMFDEARSIDLGFMRTDPVTGQSIRVSNPAVKRRRDCMIEDPRMRSLLAAHMAQRLLPEIRKAFQFDARYIERYLVARYQADDGGFFRAHRDDTTRSTAHRRFAVTVNLNDDYEGGELIFPEFGRQLFRPAIGGAVVFSCSLLHEARPVLRGTRYCFLPFLHDEAAEAVRQDRFIDPQLQAAS